MNNNFTLQEAFEAALSVRDNGDRMRIRIGRDEVEVNSSGFLYWKATGVCLRVLSDVLNGWTIENLPEEEPKPLMMDEYLDRWTGRLLNVVKDSKDDIEFASKYNHISLGENAKRMLYCLVMKLKKNK